MTGLANGTRMGRIWKVQETGSIATVKVAVPASTGPPGPLYLVVSNDAIFGSSDQWSVGFSWCAVWCPTFR